MFSDTSAQPKWFYFLSIKGFKILNSFTDNMLNNGNVTHWKAKVLPYNFLAVRKRASLAGGLLSRRNWWEVCMNFSCCYGEIIETRECQRQVDREWVRIKLHNIAFKNVYRRDIRQYCSGFLPYWEAAWRYEICYWK